jgi:hypothetical protein
LFTTAFLSAMKAQCWRRVAETHIHILDKEPIARPYQHENCTAPVRDNKHTYYGL